MRTTGVSIYSLNNIGIMSYIDNEILERLIGTMVEGFARIEKKLDCAGILLLFVRLSLL